MPEPSVDASAVPDAGRPRVRAFLGLGSNLGDRLRHLRDAVATLRGVGLVAVSPVYETDPVGGPPGQDRFLNLVVELHTDRQPPMHDVPQTLHLVEQGLYVLNGFRVPVQRKGFNALLLRGLQQRDIPLPELARLIKRRHLDGEAGTVDGSTGLK